MAAGRTRGTGWKGRGLYRTSLPSGPRAGRRRRGSVGVPLLLLGSTFFGASAVTGAGSTRLDGSRLGRVRLRRNSRGLRCGRARRGGPGCDRRRTRGGLARGTGRSTGPSLPRCPTHRLRAEHRLHGRLAPGRLGGELPDRHGPVAGRGEPERERASPPDWTADGGRRGAAPEGEPARPAADSRAFRTGHRGDHDRVHRCGLVGDHRGLRVDGPALARHPGRGDHLDHSAARHRVNHHARAHDRRRAEHHRRRRAHRAGDDDARAASPEGAGRRRRADRWAARSRRARRGPAPAGRTPSAAAARRPASRASRSRRRRPPRHRGTRSTARSTPSPASADAPSGRAPRPTRRSTRSSDHRPRPRRTYGRGGGGSQQHRRRRPGDGHRAGLLERRLHLESRLPPGSGCTTGAGGGWYTTGAAGDARTDDGGGGSRTSRTTHPEASSALPMKSILRIVRFRPSLPVWRDALRALAIHRATGARRTILPHGDPHLAATVSPLAVEDSVEAVRRCCSPTACSTRAGCGTRRSPRSARASGASPTTIAGRARARRRTHRAGHGHADRRRGGADRRRSALGPVHFVGMSMGGFVGMRLAARRPELVRSLVADRHLRGSRAPGERPPVPPAGVGRRWFGTCSVVGRVHGDHARCERPEGSWPRL